MNKLRTRSLVVPVSLLGLSLACSGDVGGDESPGVDGVGVPGVPGNAVDPTVQGAPFEDSTAPGASSVAPGPGDNAMPVGNPVPVEAVGVSTRFPRLTHSQWRNTLMDLFGLSDADLDYELSPDAKIGLYDTNQARTRVRDQLRTDYERAAEGIAQTLTPDRAAIDLLLGGPVGADAGAALARNLASRLYRRPATEQEVAQLSGLYEAGTTAYENLDPIAAGARLMLTFLLQSPHFLYRVEASSEVDPATGLVPLNGWELATRLSYLFTNSTPDAALLAAASTGELLTDAGLQAQVNRLVASEHVARMVDKFYAQGLGSDEWGELTKSSDAYPDFDTQQSAFFEDSTLMFVRDIAINQTGGLREMLMTPKAFVNEHIAQWYGVSGEGLGQELMPVELDATERAGLLTQLGFLAYYATDSATDPIHRGFYVNDRLICRTVPPAPADVPPLPDDDGGAQTVRERVEFHTTACGGGCHAPLLNAAGFAFERYGALGEVRDTDNGQPVNAKATLILDGMPRDYDGAIEFSTLLSEAREVHSCFGEQWVEYALGRDIAEEDDWLIERVANVSYESGAPILQIVAQIAMSAAFRNRAPDAEVALQEGN